MSTEIRRLLERAREATGTLRDAAREGRVIDFRQRDPLVMAIHRAFDACEEALLAPPGVSPRPSTEERCDHKFIDSTHCLKCGWTPPAVPSPEDPQPEDRNEAIRSLRTELLAALKGVVLVCDRNTREFDVARAVIAKAEEADPLLGQWHPIETAPKDGGVVIGFDPTRDDLDPEDEMTGGVEFMRWLKGAWLDPCTHSMKPTHWMPMPASPARHLSPEAQKK
jgi:hypothetical protein